MPILTLHDFLRIECDERERYYRMIQELIDIVLFEYRKNCNFIIIYHVL